MIKNCPMRCKNGNCLPNGGFCTSVIEPICEALQQAYEMGKENNAQKCEAMVNEHISRFGPRLCCVKNLRMPNEEKKRALFHRWIDNAYIKDGILIGSVSGQVWEVGGLVEYENGEVDIVPCKAIEFLSEKEA